jgi:hypothetical protein
VQSKCIKCILIGGLALAAAAGGQTPGKEPDSGPPAIRVQDGGANGRMESIFIPPKPANPFTLWLATEWSRPMDPGGTLTLTNERRIARDARGRIYQERWILVPKGGTVKSTMDIFQITDPDEHTWLNCAAMTKVCELLTYHLTAEQTYLPPIRQTGSLPGGRGTHLHQDLGSQTIDGVETHGYRETQTLNPGVLGNDAPMVTVHEFWYAEDLGINLHSIVESPMNGRQVFDVRELSLGEPDPTLFMIPEEYKVVDHRVAP